MKLKPDVGERMFRAFLDLVILRLLEEHAMSAYEIGMAVTKNFGLRVVPSTIYAKLYSLEKQKQIRADKNKSGKSYSLTELGKQTVSNMPLTIEEINDSVKILLSKNSLCKKRETEGTMTVWEQRMLLKLLQQDSKQPSHATA
ncbi:MAG: PadR family transcriptional regulator [Candidatus Bathyarchaeota archaeon]|nr:PadR family transcriptional regulator [Candidatus Bathyarchaeota archaeon]